MHDASLGWAAGDGGLMLRTTDAGESWNGLRPVPSDLYSVYFLDDQIGWAVGAGGRVVRTTSGMDF